MVDFTKDVGILVFCGYHLSWALRKDRRMCKIVKEVVPVDL